MEQLTQARTLVEQAEKAQAGRYAPADLQRAHEELSEADAANGAGKYDLARSDAESAAVDADVAAANASKAQALAAIEEVRRSNEALRTHSDGSGTPDLGDYPASRPGTPAGSAPEPERVPLPPPDTSRPR